VKPSPSIADEWRANPLSYLTWSWMNPLVHLGRKRPLEQSDLGDLAPCDQSAVLSEELLKRFAAKPSTRGPNRHLWLSMIAMQKLNVTLGSISKEVGDMLSLVGPIALQGIVAFVTDKSEGRRVSSFGGLEIGYWLVIASCSASVLQSFALHHSYQAFIRAGIQAKQAVSLAIFRKAMSLSAAQRQAIGSGKIQNLMSNDANAVGLAFNFVNYLWAIPIQVRTPRNVVASPFDRPWLPFAAPSFPFLRRSRSAWSFSTISSGRLLSWLSESCSASSPSRG
jgi:ATP-binding cassette, subfamily C (CFTR/MRP), member 1